MRRPEFRVETMPPDLRGEIRADVTANWRDSDNNGKQDIKQIVDNAPISIVGAGVSTCAPTAPQ